MSSLAIGSLLLCAFGSTYVAVFAILGRMLGAAAPPAPAGRLRRFLILVPAHNEAQDILPTLESLRNQDYPPENVDLVVIADNCTDATAQVVQSAGVTCWERTNLERRGKGFALQWAIEKADGDFDAVFIVDADSKVNPRALQAVDAHMAAGAHAVQVRYSFAPSTNSPFQAITYVSKLAETECFWAPRSRLGLTVFIQGNGFALDRESLAVAPWRSFSIVEDVEHTIDLLEKGMTVALASEVEVVARQPQSASDAVPQRIRWASGTFSLIGEHAVRLIGSAIRSADWRAAEGALALLFTSRVLLLYLFGVGLILSFFVRGTALVFALGLLGVSLFFQLIYFVLVIAAASRSGETLKALLVAPFYLVWLAFIHLLSAAGIKRGVWSRTVR